MMFPDFKALFGISRAAVLAIVFALLLAIAGIGAWRASAAFSAMIDGVRIAAERARDTHWKAEIEKANAQAAQAAADQARQSAEIDALSRAGIEKLSNELSKLEALNAALPNGNHCGIGRDRVRLLRR